MSTVPTDTISVKTADNVSLGYGVAGVGSRLIAQVIDNLIAIPLTLVALLGYVAVTQALATSAQGSTFGALGASAFAIFVYLGYFLVAETVSGGRTPGKAAMGLRVISIEGGSADLKQLLVRNVVRIIDSILYLGILVMFFHPLSRRLGDLAGGTLVVRERTSLSLAAASAPPPVVLRTPDAGPSVDGLERLGRAEHDALRVFLSRPGLTPELRHRLAGEIAVKLLHRMALPPLAPERMWPPELLLERIYLQLEQRAR